MAWDRIFSFGIVVVTATVVSAALIVLLRPLLLRYALAHPNHRSSHTTPTPQAGGIAVMAAVAAATGFGLVGLQVLQQGAPAALLSLLAGTIVLTAVGAVDDIVALAPLPRLALQALAVTIVVANLPSEVRLTPFLPFWVERILAVIGGLWFINIVNFMDGIDWMTVAEFVPVTIGLAIINLWIGDGFETLLPLALLGAILGFAPFNRPVAKLFLGDVGSLPLGLLLFWLLAQLAAHGYHTAAVLLPLYYGADATITLVRRWLAGEAVTQAHRNHFYQRATRNGFSVIEVVGRVFAVNVALVALAMVAVARPSVMTNVLTLLAGSTLVGAVLLRFSRGTQH